MTGIRFPPNRAGWLVVTRNDRSAWAGLIGSALMCSLFGFTLVFDVIRGRPFHWFYALYFVFTFLWTVRFLGNVMWLRWERLSPDTDTPD